MTTLTFRQVETLDPSTQPLPRQGHASVFHKGCLYVFGGRVQGSGRIYVNDLWKYDTAQNRWEELIAADPSHMPRKRHNHSCVVEMNAIYVFGGQTVSDEYLGDLWRFDLDTRQWSELATSQPRHSHSALKHERSMVIFGGRTGLKPAVYSNEILVYDFDSNAWDSLYAGDDQNPTTVAPHPRSYTSIVQCGQYLVVFGGYWWNGKEHYFDDTFSFCLNSHEWVKLSPLRDERVPHRRNRHSVLSLPATDVGSMSGMIIFGGNYYGNRRATDKFFGDAWLFGSLMGESLTSGRWSKVTLLGDIPCPRGHHTWVNDDQDTGRTWMFGGEANRQRFNDLYEVRVEVPAV
ncbi:kelch domain-containing protein 3 [Entomortierella chlamydospora]|uniref:Kelch domain-containing protein 3 n=1 Tax=Entomortierella chlamydospora TaxID=101097 RepID=A0A9P6MV07_9FUNG|nr:kelch domain-containing protein 3 [Entomortierella chlamydospora]